jgi:hypothetical protein
MYHINAHQQHVIRNGVHARLKRLHLTRGVAVEDKVVGSARRKTGDLALVGKSNDARDKGSRGPLALESKEVCGETSDVGGSHGGSRDGVGGAADPSRQNVDTRSETIDNGAVVGERSPGVVDVSSTDGENSGLGCGRRVGSIGVVVTGGNRKEETGGDSRGSGRVDSGRLAAAEGHGANGTTSASGTGLLVVGGVVDACNDTRVGSRAAGVKDLDTEEGGCLGYTVALGANSSGAVSSVAIAIGVLAVTGVVGKEGCTCVV